MAEATNSKRSLLQATYTPIKSIEAKQLQAADQPANGAAQSPKRAWEKWAFIASLEMRREEISKLKDRVSQSWRRLGQTDATAIEDYLRALNVIEATLPELGEPSGVQSASSFADLSPAALANVGEELMRLRAEDVVAATSAVATLAKQFEQPAETPPAVPANPKLLAGWQPVSGLPAETLAVGPVYVFEESQHFKSAVPGSDQVLAGERKTVKVQQVAPQTAAVTTTVSSPPADVSLQTLLDWAIRDGRNAALVQLVRNVTALIAERHPGLNLSRPDQGLRDARAEPELWLRPDDAGDSRWSIASRATQLHPRRYRTW